MPTLDAVTSAKIDANIQLTFAHTTGNYPSRILIVTLMTGEGAVAGGADTCTYDAVGATEVGYKQVPTSGQGAYMFILANPNVGAHNVVINIDGRYPNTTIQATARTYYRCSGYRTIYEANASDAAPTITVVDSVLNDLVVDIIGNAPNSSVTPQTAAVGGSQTQRSNHFQASAAKEARESTSEESASGANTVMSWTLGGAQRWAIIATALKPAPVGSQAIIIG